MSPPARKTYTVTPAVPVDVVHADGTEHTYEAAGELPVPLLDKAFALVEANRGSGPADAKIIFEMYDEILLGDSAERFAAALRDRQIGVRTAVEIFADLFTGHYTEVPTRPSSDSVNGQQSTGLSSTGPAPAPASTP